MPPLLPTVPDVTTSSCCAYHVAAHRPHVAVGYRGLGGRVASVVRGRAQEMENEYKDR